MAQLEKNRVIAERFRLEREIGRGGMGSVWLAHHTELDVACAVKFMEAANNEQARERFRREAKAAAKLRSSHVVQVFDHGVWEGVPYIVMELLEGEDLRSRLSTVGRLPTSECYALMKQVARALGKAHAMGIVHRDLKPDNIFISKDDGHETVKVLDFGIAKIMGDQVAAGVETKTGTLLGTPYYMSPEQLQGNKAIDRRSDLWSLAVVIYECLVGERPFQSDGMGDLVMQIMGFPLPVPTSKAPGLPTGFDLWWVKAASRDPRERYGDVHEMMIALASALGEEAPSSDAGSRSSGPGVRTNTPDWQTFDSLNETAEAPRTPAPSEGSLARSGAASLTKSVVPGPGAAGRWGLAAVAVVVAVVGGLVATRAPGVSVAAPVARASVASGAATSQAGPSARHEPEPVAEAPSAAPPQLPSAVVPVAAVSARTPPGEPAVKKGVPVVVRKEVAAPPVQTSKRDMGF